MASACAHASGTVLGLFAIYGGLGFTLLPLSDTAYASVTVSMNDENRISAIGAKTIQAKATVSEEPVTVATAFEAGDSATVPYYNDGKIQILSGNAPLTKSAKLPERVQMSAPEYNLSSGAYNEG